MTRTQVELPTPLHHVLELIAQRENKTTAQVMRELLEYGAKMKRPETAGEGLLRLANIHAKGPTDASARIDDYLYGEHK